MVTYHQGKIENVVNDIVNMYIFQDLIIKNYHNGDLEKQKSLLKNLKKRHRLKLDRELIDEEDARNVLREYFGGKPEPQVRAIYHNILGPKSKKQKLKEKAREISRNQMEPYCKAEQLELFPE